MSVTTHYGRVSEEQYTSMRNDPDGLAQFLTGVLPEDQLLYLDKASAVIAWLLSPLKRHEQAHFAAVVRADDIESFTPPDLGPEPPVDELLIPLEGRGAKDENLDAGMGPACVIDAKDVHRYALLLEEISEEKLREKLNFQELEEAALPIDYWLEEGEEIFAGYIVPLFEQLKTFYRVAASNNQKVLVWYS
ncbi:DUF1877 family protein [Methyloversatilis discipulorum]|uniref:DUF1877 family protein n=1 Tax=Methyloversatilis discipulorum TaxID=1119528 RepID=UPI0009D9F329|nr:DUF1877 family protein [Methyloversatilis discipulorum]